MTDLQAIADAATPGEWVTDAPMLGQHDERFVGMLPQGNGYQYVMVAPDVATARFIATFDPPTVSKLLAVVEAAKDVDLTCLRIPEGAKFGPGELPPRCGFCGPCRLAAALEPFRDTEVDE